MAGSPSRPPYVKGGAGAANDSGLDLHLEEDNLVKLPSSSEGLISPSDNVAVGATESLVDIDDEVTNTMCFFN